MIKDIKPYRILRLDQFIEQEIGKLALLGYILPQRPRYSYNGTTGGIKNPDV